MEDIVEIMMWMDDLEKDIVGIVIWMRNLVVKEERKVV